MGKTRRGPLTAPVSVILLLRAEGWGEAQGAKLRVGQGSCNDLIHGLRVPPHRSTSLGTQGHVGTECSLQSRKWIKSVGPGGGSCSLSWLSGGSRWVRGRELAASSLPARTPTYGSLSFDPNPFMAVFPRGACPPCASLQSPSGLLRRRLGKRLWAVWRGRRVSMPNAGSF